MLSVSIVVPVYKDELYLARCVDSILNQTFADFELLMTDDGSYDLSAEMCDESLLKDSRLLTIHKTNAGVSSARNCGLDLMHGEYVTFVDSDDYVDKFYIEHLYFAMSQSNSMVSACRFTKFTNKDEAFASNHISFGYECVNLDYFFGMDGYSTYMWGKMFDKRCFSKVRFPIDIRIMEETSIIPEVFAVLNSVAVLDYPLYYYNQNEYSALHKDNSIVDAENIIWSIDIFIRFLRKRNLANALCHVYGVKLIQLAGLCIQYKNTGMIDKYRRRLKILRKMILNYIIKYRKAGGYRIIHLWLHILNAQDGLLVFFTN